MTNVADVTEPVVEPVTEPVVEPTVEPVVEPAVEPDDGKVIWPDKWREDMAGDDAKKLTRLGRFDHPGTMFDSYLELEQKYQSAEIRTPFPEEGSDDDKALWREKNEVPAEAAGYFEGLPEGVQVAEVDKAGMDVLAETMHAGNHSAAATHAAMGAYYKYFEEVHADRAEADVKAKRDTDDALNEMYGPDFRRNINDLDAWLDTGGEGFKDKLFGARMPDGTPVGSDPEFLKFMIGQMRDINPVVTVPGLGGGDPVAALETEIAEIQKMIKNDNKAYRADPKTQARYRELITARDKNK